MTDSQATMTHDEIVKKNLEVVDQHFHNENPEDIDKAVAVYGDEIVWEVPARGLVYRDHEQVREEYLRVFNGTIIHKLTRLRTFGTPDWVFDDSVFEMTTGDGFRNAPYPPGTRVTMRLVHAFELKDFKIVREIGYEVWRRTDDELRVVDDIPEGAEVQVFD